MNGRSDGVPLDRVGPGRYMVVGLHGGYGFKNKLSDMGIYPGSVVDVIAIAGFGGPIRISVKGSQYAIGKGMASKIFVVKV